MNDLTDEKREFTKRASFEEYRLLLVTELERVSSELRRINDKVEQFRRDDVAQMKTDIALLKLQASIYGAVAGVLTTGVVTAIIKFIRV